MNKTWLIIKREYLSRVRKKTFILSTILTPLLIVGIMAFVMYITIKNTRAEKVAVVDPAGIFKSNLSGSKNVSYEFRSDVDTSNFDDKGFTVLLLPPHVGINNTENFRLITNKSLNRFTNDRIEKDISRSLENNMISNEFKVDPLRIDSIRRMAEKTTIEQKKVSELGSGAKNNFDLGSAMGYVMAFLIYITLFIYGVMVMRGVMEEKTNRIAEVMVSSVKPFQMMMGKIVGIGAVGLTQFLIWILLLLTFSMIAGAMIPHDVLQQVGDARNNMPVGTSMPQASGAVYDLAKVQNSLSTVNWPVVIGCFIFYFLGGYLFYASLFAAVGSSVNEDAQDAQSLTLPITLPIIIAIIIMVNAINDPTSPLATWSSIIPFFSPIVMMARIPFGVPSTVPYWELGLSMLLLILGFLFTTWLSAKIYRTGILLYGKKPTWKEMIKWVRR